MRKLFLLIMGCTCLLLAGYAAYLGYTKAKEARLLGMARAFVARSDMRNAILSLSEALQIDPQNIEATRLMADCAAATERSNSVQWRSRVVELDPRSTADRVALASAAMMSGNFALATNSLQQVPPGYRKTAAYQNTAGALAIAAHDPALAEACFREAAELDPESLAPQLNYAVTRLHSTNLVAEAEARTELTKMAASSVEVFRRQALRELTADAFVHGQADLALRRSQSLLMETNSQFADRILQLVILQQIGGDQFSTAIKTAQAAAGNDPTRIFELASWEMKYLSPDQTLDWMQHLPAATQSSQPVALLSAQCRILQGDWHGLDHTLGAQKWGDLEFVRHAFRARAFSETKMHSGMAGEWEKSIQDAGMRINDLTVLYCLTKQWNWPKEEEDLLWIIVRNHPQEKWAAPILADALVAGGRTQSLMLLCNLQLEHDSSDILAKNNLAMTALLLNALEQKPFKLAREVFDSCPTNVSFAATYAFSLYRQHKNTEALQVIQQLDPRDLRDPEVAGYYGIILQANGQMEKAGTYLKLAGQAQLLPEERILFAATK
jgi:tetratricopeptide (TPR) repeat protein